jgi:hypothetical protein
MQTGQPIHNCSVRGAALILAVAAILCQPVFAAEFVGTDINGGHLLYLTTPTKSATILTTGAKPDGVILGPFQQIIYVLSGAGEVHIFNPYRHSDSTLATGLSTPVGLVLEPGCKTILVSDVGLKKIFRITLSTHAVTTFYNGPDTIQGLTYDKSGNLFAADDQLSAIVQFNPTTGQIINQTPVSWPLTALEGITYDAFTGELFATSNTGQVVYEVTTNLVSISTIAFAQEPFLDGIISDSHGNLYVVASDGTNGTIVQYSITYATQTTLDTAPGLNNIAPILSGPCIKTGGVAVEACDEM